MQRFLLPGRFVQQGRLSANYQPLRLPMVFQLCLVYYDHFVIIMGFVVKNKLYERNLLRNGHERLLRYNSDKETPSFIERIGWLCLLVHIVFSREYILRQFDIIIHAKALSFKRQMVQVPCSCIVTWSVSGNYNVLAKLESLISRLVKLSWIRIVHFSRKIWEKNSQAQEMQSIITKKE